MFTIKIIVTFFIKPNILYKNKKGVDFMGQMNNMDMGKLMEMVSQMDKKQIEQGLAKASQILSAEDKNKIINMLNKNQK